MVTDYMAGRLVRLRALEPDDEPLLHTWMNDAVVQEYYSGRYPFAHQQEHDYLAASPPAFGNARFGILALDEGSLIGVTSLEGARPESRSATLALMIGDRRYWDRGYGSDALHTLCRFGFEMMNLHRIELDVFEENIRAIRVYDRIGFQREGVRREASYRGGRYHDIIVMGLLRNEFR